MNIFREIGNALKERWRSGETHQDIADQSGLARSYIGRLMNGKCPTSALTLESFFKLFPRASVSLDGAAVQSQPGVDPATAGERKLLSLFRELSEDEQLDVILEVSRRADAEKTGKKKTNRTVVA